MDGLDAFLRVQSEPLTYLVFFGLLAPLILLEGVVSRSAEAPRRRRRWTGNYAMTALNIVVLGAIPVSAVMAADYARDNGIGLLNLLPIDPWTAVVAALLARSLVSWAIHLAMHKVPWLWRLHRVHHSDPVLDVSTTVRMHPLEFVVNAPLLIGAAVLLGLPPAALMLYELADTALAVFSHANIRLPARLERLLNRVIVTPDVHRIHHSSLQPETDSNYGATLTIWDRLFGTYREKPGPELATMTIGLDEYRGQPTASLFWMLLLPFRPFARPSKDPTIGQSLAPQPTRTDIP
ncbi:sterol desaturase family protein [Oceanibacterium hippocampi]|uniref:Fatty acid hydroxylase superfamily protein n=1 Tax=Oceanibacterium hippocampi TaxID=745714 RepID=A0A1Y5SMY0_9PROT|nr:sterol desaturase family protein [Oceanibacterium hippocampi]SLN41446.1 Fatty acid hydroxylase superfamily protein [Oceanibacterium hippocampi]